MSQAIDASVKGLIAKGKERGYLTYEEMNDDLPDEAVSPDKLDSLLMTLDELGIELIDEAEVDAGEAFAEAAEAEEEAAEKPRRQRGRPKRGPRSRSAGGSTTPSACTSRRWARSRC